MPERNSVNKVRAVIAIYKFYDIINTSRLLNDTETGNKDGETISQHHSRWRSS